MCGLKLGLFKCILTSCKSHPSWVCGLKLKVQHLMTDEVSHTLRGCVDWNYPGGFWLRTDRRHTLRGCVDWNLYLSLDNCRVWSHTLRGCVDWNSITRCITISNWRHTLRGCVDWNFLWYMGESNLKSHTLRGCVDWNTLAVTHFCFGCVTPFVGVWIETHNSLSYRKPVWVTPFVGVWIETVPSYEDGMDGDVSHPSWVCGLKPISL